jgi:uncharacterized protein YidB (DUF937 family)
MSLFDQLSSALSGEHAGLLGNVLDTLSKEQGGGLPGLIQAFQANGLGDVVSSWIGTGPNQLAARMGIAPDAMSARLAEVLPGAIDTLTPNGKLPDGGLLAQALSALRTKVS